MEKEFVPYDLALKLKELGFNEKCLGGYDKTKKKWWYHPDSDVILDVPLWQQAFDWFRKEKDLLNHLTTHLNAWGENGGLETSFGYRIMFDKDGWKCEVWERLSRYETYEESRKACLEKLIELCQQN